MRAGGRVFISFLAKGQEKIKELEGIKFRIFERVRVCNKIYTSYKSLMKIVSDEKVEKSRYRTPGNRYCGFRRKSNFELELFLMGMGLGGWDGIVKPLSQRNR